MAQILQSLSYKKCSIQLSKFTTFGLFILILGTSAIMDQRACCYVVKTSKIGLCHLAPTFHKVSDTSDCQFLSFSAFVFHRFTCLAYGYKFRRNFACLLLPCFTWHMDLCTFITQELNKILSNIQWQSSSYLTHFDIHFQFKSNILHLVCKLSAFHLSEVK